MHHIATQSASEFTRSDVDAIMQYLTYIDNPDDSKANEAMHSPRAIEGILQAFALDRGFREQIRIRFTNLFNSGLISLADFASIEERIHSLQNARVGTSIKNLVHDILMQKKDQYQNV